MPSLKRLSSSTPLLPSHMKGKTQKWAIVRPRDSILVKKIILVFSAAHCSLFCCLMRQFSYRKSEKKGIFFNKEDFDVLFEMDVNARLLSCKIEICRAWNPETTKDFVPFLRNELQLHWKPKERSNKNFHSATAENNLYICMCMCIGATIFRQKQNKIRIFPPRNSYNCSV